MAYREDFILGRSLPEWPRSTPRPSVTRNILDFAPHRPLACPEIDCVRRLLSPETLAWAEHRAAHLGTGADRVLIADGTIAEERYLATLASWLGTGHLMLDDVPRTACPLSDSRLIHAARAGVLPLHTANGLTWVVAPRHLAARTLARLVSRSPDLARRIYLTSSENSAALSRGMAKPLSVRSPTAPCGNGGRSSRRHRAVGDFHASPR